MKNLIKKFWKDEDGATIMEYILMIAVGAGIIALLFPFIKGALAKFTDGAVTEMGSGIADGMCDDTTNATQAFKDACTK